MTATILTGLALALTASVAQSAGFLFQHIRAAERPPVTPLRPIASLGALLQSRWWVLGLALGIAGFALHLAALSIAPLSLVQAFVAGGLALAAPLAAFGFHHRLTRTELRSVLLMAAALTVLPLGIGQPHGGFEAITLGAYLAAVAVVAALTLLLTGTRRFAALGLAAGLLYGILDTVLKALTEIAHRQGLAAAVASPWLLVAVAATVGAFFCFQRALQTNTALTAIGLMEAGADSSSIIAGFVVFGDSLGASLPLAIVHGLAFCVVGFAAWSLAQARERLALAEGEAPSHGRPDRPLASQRLA